MILNLHGLYGHSENNNYQQLSLLFPKEEIYSPQIDYLAEDPQDLLDTLAQNGPYSLVVGNSLGGFFAYALGAKKGYSTVLTNPCVPPYEYLPNLAGDYRYLDKMKRIWNDAYPRWFKCVVVLGRRDEVIDHKNTFELMKPYYRIHFIDCEHVMFGPEYTSCFEVACREARYISS